MPKHAPLAVAALALFLAVWPPGTAQAERYRPLVREWNVSSPGNDTDIITDLTWEGSETLRLTIQCATASVVNLMVTRGGVEIARTPNLNAAVVAGAEYSWDFDGMKDGDTVNVQVETTGVISHLAIGAVR